MVLARIYFSTKIGILFVGETIKNRVRRLFSRTLLFYFEWKCVNIVSLDEYLYLFFFISWSCVLLFLITWAQYGCRVQTKCKNEFMHVKHGEGWRLPDQILLDFFLFLGVLILHLASSSNLPSVRFCVWKWKNFSALFERDYSEGEMAVDICLF